jgi:hypothetical protein
MAGNRISEACVVSSRWSYGPDGLREREVEHKPLWPRWRELQPFLLRSAGIVGLVATIMAVVSSDALHLGGGDEPAALAAVDPVDPPVVAAASEVQATPDEIAAEAPAEGGPFLEAAVEPPVADPAAEAPSTTPAPIMVTTVSIIPDAVPQLSSEARIADLIKADAAAANKAELEVQPVGVEATAAEAPTGEAEVSPEATPPSTITAAIEQPRGAAAAPPPEPGSETSATPTEVAATSAATPSPEAFASLAPHANDEPAAEISVSTLHPSDPPAAATTDLIAWPEDAASCSRDWVEAEGSRDSGDADCTSIDSLLASVGPDEQSVLEDAAAEEATVLAALPRIPSPRPEPPADFKPSNPHKVVRVNSQNASWPPEPPPNCAAGQRARWRFVDRRTGTKEWYCR